MKYISFALSIIIALSLLPACSTEPEAAAGDTGLKIKGVWTIETMDVGTPENRRTIVPRAFMIFIFEKHYSAIRDLAEKPAPGEESSARSFMADAGTYEFDGKELVVHHQVAMFPSLGSMTFGCTLEDADTLILTPQYDKRAIHLTQVATTYCGRLLLIAYKTTAPSQLLAEPNGKTAVLDIVIYGG